MSTLFPEEMTCPSCEAKFPFDLAYSINAVRRPEHRAAILSDQFQTGVCPACGFLVRAAPQFTYIDLSRKQWILVQPAEELCEWAETEQVARELFDTTYGPSAPPSARSLGEGLAPRVVFGWAALREKLLCQERGIPEVDLELIKLALMRDDPELDLEDGVELRLIDDGEDKLLFGWINVLTEEIGEAMEVPRGAIEAVQDPAWGALRIALSGHAYTDLHRLFSADPVPAAAEA